MGLAIFSRTSHGCNYEDSNMMKKTKNASFSAKKHSSFDLELADANKVLYDLAQQYVFICTGSVKWCTPKLFVCHMYTVVAMHSACIVCM